LGRILGRGCSTATFEKLDVNAINCFFTNLGPETVKSIPQSASSHMKFVLPVANTFFSFEVTHNELFNVVTSLPSKTSSGFDKLSTRNLKLIFPYISDTVLKIVNKSFRTGIFPDILKIARVIPIHKGGSKDKLINYRPISVLSSFSKIIERLMFNRMCNFIEKYHILSDTQFGFRKNRNTELAVLNAVNYITKALDNDVPVVGLFADLSKAFDTIDHSILLDKLYALGFRGTSHKWFSCYLTNRYQYVELAGSKSCMSKLTTGVPQGSVLGPLLFLLYINDLTCVSKSLQFTLFADDTTVLYSNKSLVHNLNDAAQELEIVFDWFVANRLCVNVDKTHFMFFSKRGCVCDRVLKLRSCSVKLVQSTKFLGVYIDDKLNWAVHITELVTKLNRSLGMMKVASHCLPHDVLLQIFYAFFYSHLTYGVLVWGNSHACHLHPVEVLYKKCLRLLCGKSLFEHTPPLAKQLNLVVFSDLYVWFLAVFMFKVYWQLLPQCILHMFTSLHTFHTRTRQSCCDFFLPRVRLNVCKQFVTFSGVQCWNSLPTNVKLCTSLNLFKNALYKKLSCSYD
jgi:hypothetical protein